MYTVQPPIFLQTRPLRLFKQVIWEDIWYLRETDRQTDGRTDGRTGLTFKLDFPGQLCRAAFAILAMFKTCQTKASKGYFSSAPSICFWNLIAWAPGILDGLLWAANTCRLLLRNLYDGLGTSFSRVIPKKIFPFVFEYLCKKFVSSDCCLLINTLQT